MSLTSLPNELLSIIFEQCLLSGGFQDLALSCKKCYTVSQGYIRMQREEKTSWIQKVTKGGCLNSAPDIIRAILENSDRARWTRDICLQAMPYASRKRSLNSTELKSLIERITSQPWLSTIFRNDASNPWLQSVGLGFDRDSGKTKLIPSQDRRKNSWQRNNVYVIMLLVLLTCNLTELSLPSKWRYTEEEDLFMLNRITRHIRTRQSFPESMKNKLPPLVNLQRLSCHCSPGDKTQFVFKLLAPFLGLPSLKLIDVASSIAVDNLSSGMTFQWPYRRFLSNLTEINLRKCCFEPKAVSELLSHTPFVQIFSYSHAKIGDYGQNWNASAFVMAVGQCIGKTLRDLSISYDRTACFVTTGVHSLKDFIVLEKCRIGLDVIRGPPADSVFTLHQSDRHWKRWSSSSIRETMPIIEDILPNQIKRFILETQGGPSMSTRRIAALQALFQTKKRLSAPGAFADLEWLVVEMHGGSQCLGWIKDSLEACKATITDVI